MFFETVLYISKLLYHDVISNCKQLTNSGSVDKFVDYVDVHALGCVFLALELMQLEHNSVVGFAEHPFDLIDTEGAPRRVICTVLKVPNEWSVLISVSMLLSCEGEEAGTVHAVRRRVEVLAKELKELRQVL